MVVKPVSGFIAMTARFKLFLFVIVGWITACSSSSNPQNQIPDPTVELTLYLSLPSNQKLNTVGGWVYLNNVGFKGIWVYRASQTEFRAYERACTYQPQVLCHQVSVDTSNNILLKCDCCTSKWSFDNVVMYAPATLPLKIYRTFFNSQNQSLDIYN
jgi:hypothetical protein